MNGDPKAMYDLLLAVAQKRTILQKAPGRGYQRSDGLHVFAEDVSDLIGLNLLRRTDSGRVEFGRWTAEYLASVSPE